MSVTSFDEPQHLRGRTVEINLDQLSRDVSALEVQPQKLAERGPRSVWSPAPFA
jgi:hypothetical protein